MTTRSVLTIPLEEIALSETAGQLPDVYFYVEQTAMADTDDTLNLWIATEDSAAIDGALEDDPSVTDYERLKGNDDEYLYRVTLAKEVRLVRELIHGYDGTITEVYGDADGWTLEVRFPDREQFSELDDEFEGFGIHPTYETIESIDDSDDEPMNVLTDSQRRSIELAVDRGYYQVPREVSLQELAREMDISHQALSERLRRAEKRLAEEKLTGAAEDPSKQDGRNV
jgi:predicted DNA binding protein